MKKWPISRVFDNKNWLWCPDDFKINSLWSLGPLLSFENWFDGHRMRETEAEDTFLKTLHSNIAEKVKFLPLKVRLGVWAVLKFKKWSTRYVFDFKNGLVRRVAFPFGFYDTDGLGESRRSIVYVVKGSQFFFSRFGSLDRQFSKIHFFRSVGPIWRNFLKNVKNDQHLAFSIIKNDCGVLMTSKSFLCEA